MNVAVIDLGTNTFNCCVASLYGNNFKTLLEFHEYPRLGENGVAFGYISDEAMERGIQSLRTIKERIEPFDCQKVTLIGTSALRNANNANVFSKRVEELFGFHITIIPGEQEAEYIFLGNNLAFDWGEKTALILDIGGGSNECIICHQNEILWKHSFECGMQRIVSKFGLSHPLPQTTLDNITDYLNEKFALLTEIVPQYSIDLLIGSAGAFDVFRSIYFAQQNIPNPQSVAQEIPMNDFKAIVEYLCTHSIDEIESMKGMCIPRAPLLPIAGCIANFVVSKYSIPQLFQSSYSLKEGVIHTMMQ
jgi:exopolyphosphatase/guanosine-5'-triphosphate,3'-diphosphate pyrophosphatase